MAQAVGARVRRMNAAEVAVPLTPPRSLVAGILVNGHRQRFINEDTYYGRVGQEALFHQDGRMFLVVDEATYEPTIWGTRASWVCETGAELEAEIGLPPGSLETTLDLYNRAFGYASGISLGDATLFGRFAGRSVASRSAQSR